jgi:hypothetical protein
MSEEVRAEDVEESYDQSFINDGEYTQDDANHTEEVGSVHTYRCMFLYNLCIFCTYTSIQAAFYYELAAKQDMSYDSDNPKWLNVGIRGTEKGLPILERLLQREKVKNANEKPMKDRWLQKGKVDTLGDQRSGREAKESFPAWGRRDKTMPLQEKPHRNELKPTTHGSPMTTASSRQPVSVIQSILDCSSQSVKASASVDIYSEFSQTQQTQTQPQTQPHANLHGKGQENAYISMPQAPIHTFTDNHINTDTNIHPNIHMRECRESHARSDVAQSGVAAPLSPRVATENMAPGSGFLMLVDSSDSDDE